MPAKLQLQLHNRTKKQLDKQKFYILATKVLQDTPLEGIVEVNLTVSGDDYIERLNSKYRHIDHPTDVLSFPIVPLERGHRLKDTFPNQPHIPTNLGDIVISYPTAERQAKEHHHSAEEEMLLLFEHGLKHLLGFHHK